MQDRTKPTQAQIDYACRLLVDLGYMRDDVRDMVGKDFDDLTRGELSRLIDELKHEFEG